MQILDLSKYLIIKYLFIKIFSHSVRENFSAVISTTWTDPIEAGVVKYPRDVLCSDSQYVGRCGVDTEGAGDDKSVFCAVGVRLDLPCAPLRRSPRRLGAQSKIPHTLQV